MLIISTLVYNTHHRNCDVFPDSLLFLSIQEKLVACTKPKTNHILTENGIKPKLEVIL